MAEADRRGFDPVTTTAHITRNQHPIEDTLFGSDESLRTKLQMVDRATVSNDGRRYWFTLRYGPAWDDGQPAVSEDRAERVKRGAKRDCFGQLLMAYTKKNAPIDRKTLALELACEPRS